jgi:hypothetical protein
VGLLPLELIKKQRKVESNSPRGIRHSSNLSRSLSFWKKRGKRREKERKEREYPSFDFFWALESKAAVGLDLEGAQEHLETRGTRCHVSGYYYLHVEESQAIVYMHGKRPASLFRLKLPVGTSFTEEGDNLGVVVGEGLGQWILPLLMALLTSAFAFKRARTISKCPLEEATDSGVSPSLSALFTSALLSMR